MAHDILMLCVAGSHRFIMQEWISNEAVDIMVSARTFAMAHAKASAETVLPFTFTAFPNLNDDRHTWQMRVLHEAFRFSTSHCQVCNLCPRYFLGMLPGSATSKCDHCYINAAKDELHKRDDDRQSKQLIDQICNVSRPFLISEWRGDPCSRPHLRSWFSMALAKRLRMGPYGSNGNQIDDQVAKNLTTQVSNSLNQSRFEYPREPRWIRGVKGSWQKPSSQHCTEAKRGAGSSYTNGYPEESFRR